MTITANKASPEEIAPFRNLFLAENNFQFVHNKCHGAGWADVYRFAAGETPIGYGSVWGKDSREDRDTIFEFYLLPPYRKQANLVFPEFLTASGVRYFESQSNLPLQTAMLYEYAKNINAEAILFEDSFETNFSIPAATFGKNKDEYVIHLNGELVAIGGFVWNYNLPFIDIYYEVKEQFQRQGLATLMVQELKKEAYRLNRVPAARCNIHNLASRATLLKGGMKICGFMLVGEIPISPQ